MSEIPGFVGYPSVTRAFREFVITEKIDGTNAQVLVLPDGRVIAGSRNRYITPEADNFGFARWVAENEEMLRRLGPGRHFGEWWGSGIQRRYGMDTRVFSLFEWWREPDDVPECCRVVPIVARRTPDNSVSLGYALALAETELRERGSMAAPGFMNPEGMMITHVPSRTTFKYTFDGDGHKGAKPTAAAPSGSSSAASPSAPPRKP